MTLFQLVTIIIITYRFDIDEAISYAENANDNKENVQTDGIKQKSLDVVNVCSSDVILEPSKSVLQIDSKNDSTETTSTYDVQNRVRPANVEMFTVTLKPKKN